MLCIVLKFRYSENATIFFQILWPPQKIGTSIEIAHRMTCIPRIYNDFVCDTLVLMINVEKNSSWAFDNYIF